MAFHQFGEGVLGIRPGKPGQQFSVRGHGFSSYSTREMGKRTRKIGFDLAGKVRQTARELTAKFPLPY